MSPQSFGDKRASRYDRAIKQCLSARINEVIPILLLLYRDDLHECTLVDLASGNGYLSDVFKPFIKRVIRVDKSAAMLDKSQKDGNAIYGDLRDFHKKLPALFKADMITCLGALHHVYEMMDGRVDHSASEQTQFQVIKNWTDVLSLGGKLLLIDVCIPDLYSAKNDKPLSENMDEYYQRKQTSFDGDLFTFEVDFLKKSIGETPDYFVNSYIKNLVSTNIDGISLADILRYQRLRGLDRPNKMVSVDFFDEVVATLSIDGHIAHFSTEKFLRATLKKIGMKNILVTCIPTPWVFESEEEGVWFFRELFSLGEEAVIESKGFADHPDYKPLKETINRFLGIHTENGLTYINWQLVFAYGEKS